MTPDQLSRIRAIFESAVAASLAERAAVLDRECHGNPELRSEVERLLNARDRVPEWLDQPLLAPAGHFTAPMAGVYPKMEGRTLSGYTLIREIGRGGMGSVYLAERTDGVFHKQAAIKLVYPGANHAEIFARFRQEREILASLDHPNIARLIDGGATEEGWPYFVMEFVDGQPIHRWCDERKLNITQRIELFKSVLAAVRYAHQRLVVHRDLKPGNILVSGDGTVKLLDFGIARVLSPKPASSDQATMTMTLAHMMTPEYASPEQVNGTPITTLTDVYSLGIVLYELLTGHRPYRLQSAAVREMARVISEVEPTRPSLVVATTEPPPSRGNSPITPDAVSRVREGDPVRLRKRLEGDLDSVILTALQKEPERRYSSVEALAEDLQRHLENRPVKAREASQWHRFRRFCRRNPGGVAAAVFLVVMMLTGMLAVIWQIRRNIDASLATGADTLFIWPLWVFFLGIEFVGLGAAAYFVRPAIRRLLGALAGGLALGAAELGKIWLGASLGWWHSRIPQAPDPLSFFSPWLWLAYPLAGAALMLIMTLVGRRFGWKGQILAVALIAFWQETRERVWWSLIVPVLNFAPGPLSLIAGIAILFVGGALGLLLMRLISGPDKTNPGQPTPDRP